VKFIALSVLGAPHHFMAVSIWDMTVCSLVGIEFHCRIRFSTGLANFPPIEHVPSMRLSSFRGTKMLFLVWVISLVSIDAMAAEAGWEPRIDAACPEAVRERTQLRAARPIPKDAVTVSRPALRRELLQMEQSDQVHATYS
jgi:hypothetical protein